LSTHRPRRRADTPLDRGWPGPHGWRRGQRRRSGGNPAMELLSRRVSIKPDVMAPDGSEVRVLCATSRGGMAVFSLPPKSVSKAVMHRTVDEIWYVVAGTGRIWRKRGDLEEVADAAPGLSVAIPVGTRFQFRCDGSEPLVVVGATMPPWPGSDEAVLIEGPWRPTA
jgi:mannose-6-phosphate isomerase-like protein (cupin superfamily)